MSAAAVFIRSLAYLVERFLLRRTEICARASCYGLRFSFRAEDTVGRTIYKRGVYEANIAAFIERHIEFSDGDILVDLGANIGWYSVLFSRLAAGRDVQIFAFEPDQYNYSLLQKNIALNSVKNVVASNTAISDSSGSGSLYRHNNNNLGRHSLVPLSDSDIVNVETVTLDECFSNNGLIDRRVKLIKADIEGFEFQAFSGDASILVNTEYIIMEYSPWHILMGGHEPAQLVTLLADAGFTPYLVVNGVLAQIDLDYLKRKQEQHNLVWRNQRLLGAP